jgi:hypothetical protein
MIRKSTQLIEEIAKITKTVYITGIVGSSPRIRKKRGLFVSLMMQRSGARSIITVDGYGRVQNFSIPHEDATTSSTSGPRAPSG